MSPHAARIDTSLSVSFIASAVIHLAVFLLLAWSGRLFPQETAIQETYYVDIVNLPVVAPQSGLSAQKSGEEGAARPPVLSPPMAMPLPSKSSQKTILKPLKAAAPTELAETEAAFAERMAKLAGRAEVRQHEEKIQRMSKKIMAGSGTKAGMPGAGGAEAGSRYADFIKSRLEDALKVTSSYTTKKPEVAVRLTIGADGKLVRLKIERSSGDAAFELAVRRAIDLASEKFIPPPDRVAFENGFIFKPKGISGTAP